MSIRIAGTGSYLPERILTNADLEKMVDTSDEWIRTRTGISERHIAAADQCTSDLATEAARKALEAAELEPGQIDAVIVATCTPDYTFPGTAANVHRKLKLEKAFCFDLSAACCGFLSALEAACGIMFSNKKYRHVLVIGAEKLSTIVNWEDRSTCVLFGDGAGFVEGAVTPVPFDDIDQHNIPHRAKILTALTALPVGYWRTWPRAKNSSPRYRRTRTPSGREVRIFDW